MAHDRGSGAPRRVVRAWRRVVAAVARTGTGMAPGAVPGHLFWTSGGSMINQANLDGSNQQAIVSGQDGPAGVAVDASHLYWANDPDGTINRANEEGNGRARY
jgi:sugar phosphate isomerase/epimerase